jgi:hypothetical protein
MSAGTCEVTNHIRRRATVAWLDSAATICDAAPAKFSALASAGVELAAGQRRLIPDEVRRRVAVAQERGHRSRRSRRIPFHKPGLLIDIALHIAQPLDRWVGLPCDGVKHSSRPLFATSVSVILNSIDSRTATSTAFDASFPVQISNSRAPSLAPLVASMALTIKLSITMDPISLNERQAGRELGLQRDTIPQHFAACQGDDVADRFVDVQPITPRRYLFDEGAFSRTQMPAGRRCYCRDLAESPIQVVAG